MVNELETGEDVVVVDALHAFVPRLWPAALPPFYVYLLVVLVLSEDVDSGCALPLPTNVPLCSSSES